MIRNLLRLNRGLLSPESASRSVLLERALARAVRSIDVPDWRAAGFRVLSDRPPPALAPASLAAAERACAAAPAHFPWVWLATPVHLEPGLDNVRLPADGIVLLTASEAQELAADFGRLWADAPLRLWASGERLYLLTQAPAEARTHDPETLLGEQIDDYLPAGEGAARLKALMSEMEMWLFEHRVNSERSGLGKAVVNGLWLWGGGQRGALPELTAGAAGEDVLFGAFRAAQAAARVVIASHAPGSPEWNAEEERWMRARLKALKGDATLAISIERRLFEVDARWRWRVFRKARPWWEYF